MNFIVEDQVSETKTLVEQLHPKRKLNNNRNQHPKKQKIETFEPVQNSTKLTKAELFKPPTAEELNQLRETEILFNSNLFRLQTEELLKEISVKEKHVKLINTWIEKFSEILQNIPENIEFELSDVGVVIGESTNNTIQKRIKEIAKNNPTNIKTDQNCSFRPLKPKSINVVGLYNIKTVSKPTVNIFLNVVIPKMCFHVRDYMNSRYLVKRSLYLSYITSYLKKTDLSCEMSYSYLHGNVIIPILQIKPDIKNTVINVRVTPEDETFKISRFQPEKTNLRSTYINSFVECSLEELNSSFYNSVIQNDVTLDINDKFRSNVMKDLKGARDGIILLKIWLDQRGLLHGYGSFNEDILYSCVSYLVSTGKINKHMSSYQVIRNVWSHLANSNWETNGISLNDAPFDLERFHKHYDVVFIDRSGHCNLAADLDINIYIKVRHEAKLAMEYLDNGKFNSFQSLFITKMPPYLQYDAVIHISYDDKLENIYDTIDADKKYDYFAFKYPLILKQILSHLKEGLSDRIDYLTPITKCNTNWKIGEPVNSRNNSISIGINLNHFNLFKVVEKGPSTYDPAAKRFREFWGKKAELRRFKDGSITEAVYWAVETLQDKRKIFKEIITFVLKNKLKLKSFNILCDQFDSVLRMYPNTGLEEANLKIINTFDELGKLLRGLKLPLDITALQGVSEAFSYTDAFPPAPKNYSGDQIKTYNFKNNVKLDETHIPEIMPKYVCPVEGIIQMAQHSKWPNDYKALCNLKTAFYIEISRKLKQECNIKSNPREQFLDILYNGLVFRLTLFNPKQIIELKKIVDETGLISYEDNDASILQEQKYVLLPRLVGALNGLHAQYPSFGPSTALIKRWLNSQLIDSFHFPNIVINLLNAFLYMNSSPFTQSSLPQVAFFRFLHMLANYDWNLQPVIINFNNEITKEKLDEHESNFHRHRAQYSPLHIVTPYDNFKSLLTKYAPTIAILNRLKVLGTECISLIENNICSESLFNIMVFMMPNLNGYNVIIHLQPFLNSRWNQNTNLINQEKNLKTYTPYVKNDESKIPVIDFNPVDSYLKELRDAYDDFALFFHDSYGGNVITVLWKPIVKETEEFKISEIAGKMLTSDNKIQVNVDAIIEDFYILGKGLVKSVEKR